MIRKLEVKELNTRVDGTWEFNEDLNIITGRNGSGKTTLLKLIWYLISGNLRQLISDIPFQLVSFETDLFSMSIVHSEPDKGTLECEFPKKVDANPVKMEVNYNRPLRRTQHRRIDAISVETARGMSSLFLPSYRRIEGGFARSSKYTLTDDFVSRESTRFEDRPKEPLKDTMSRLATQVSGSDNHKFIVSISTYDIIELLTKKYADVSSNTNELHVKLSEEIMQKIHNRKPSHDAESVLQEIQNRVKQVTEEQESLLRRFSVLSERIGDILKYRGIHVAEGVTFGEAKEAIESDKLSAGEKQMLSFLCYNMFSEQAGIFIDEPELSLHLDWQRLLLPTLLEQATENQFFIATHSPFIYAKYPDKEIQLSEDYGGDL